MATLTQSPRQVRPSAETGESLPVIALATHHWRPERHQSGVVTYISNLVEGMRRLNAPIYVVANQVGAELPGASEPYEAHVRRVPGWGAVRGRVVDRVASALARRVCPDYASIWMMARRLLAVIEELQRSAGVQSFETEESCGVAALLAPRCPVPVVLRLHGPWFLVGPAAGAVRNAQFERRLRWEGLAMTRAAAISTPSRDVLDRAEACYEVRFPRSAVIPNPVRTVPESRQWSLEACDRHALLFVGRCDGAKGADLLLDAFACVLREQPAARLTMVGSEPGSLEYRDGSRLSARAYLERVLPDASLRSRVEWRGVCSAEEIAHLRKQAYMCVVASRYESFSMVTLEAMAGGCPLVAPRVGGIPELIRDGHNGKLFHPGSAADLAEAIIQLMNQPSMAQALGRQAAEDAVRNYSPTEIARRTLEYHGEIIAQQRSRV